MANVFGVDISQWQNPVNFSQLATAAKFAIMKAGGSNVGYRYVDKTYNGKVDAARAAGLAVGHYWMNGKTDPAGDGAYFAANLRGYSADDILVLDIETIDGVSAWGPDKALAFFRAVKAAKPNAKLYAYMSAAETRAKNWAPLVEYGVGLWVASWGKDDGKVPAGSPSIRYWSDWRIWQYTSRASVPGISSKVDGNLARVGVFGSAPATPAPTPTPSKPSTGGKTYTVKKGDTLSGIGAKIGVPWTKLYADNKATIGSNASLIRPGMVLKYGSGATAPAAPAAKTYTVKKGDTLSGIGAKYGVPWLSIYSRNKATIGSNASLIRPGMVLVIP